MTNLLSIEALQTKADALAAEINAVDPEVTFIYCVHNSGQLKSNIQMIEDTILDHPAGMIAATLLKRNFPTIEPSGFQGLAARQTTHWMAMSKTVSFLGIVSINIDQYPDYYDALFDLYRHTWHAIETVDLCQDRNFLETFGDRLLIPKRKALGETRANLRSDIFACLVLRTEGYEDIIETTGKKRALQSLKREIYDTPEKFPFLTTVQATRFAGEEIINALDHERSRLEKCKDLTKEISSVTTDEQIRQWWRFCEPAQDMAWRGYKPDIILSAALTYGDDPYVRAITHLVQELSGIQPAPSEQLEGTFNPFIDIQRNERTHISLIEETFETALAQGLDENSSRPFFATAAKQNQELAQGRFLGWCAAALQGAARAFDQASIQGRPLAQAAQLEFQMAKSMTPIETLYKLSAEIINEHKSGHIILLKDIPQIARKLQDMEIVSKSFEESVDFIRNEDLKIKIQSESLDMVLMPNTPTLSREFGVKMQPKIPAEHAFPAEYEGPAPVLDFAPGEGPALPPQIRKPITPEKHASHPAPEPRQKIMALDGETGLSLDFEEAKEEKTEE